MLHYFYSYFLLRKRKIHLIDVLSFYKRTTGKTSLIVLCFLKRIKILEQK
jgi:hypothetical protein